MHAMYQEHGYAIVKLLVESNADMDAKDHVSGMVRGTVRVRVRVGLGFESNADNTNANNNTREH